MCCFGIFYLLSSGEEHRAGLSCGLDAGPFCSRRALAGIGNIDCAVRALLQHRGSRHENAHDPADYRSDESNDNLYCWPKLARCRCDGWALFDPLRTPCIPLPDSQGEIDF